MWFFLIVCSVSPMSVVKTPIEGEREGGVVTSDLKVRQLAAHTKIRLCSPFLINTAGFHLSHSSTFLKYMYSTCVAVAVVIVVIVGFT